MLILNIFVNFAFEFKYLFGRDFKFLKQNRHRCQGASVPVLFVLLWATPPGSMMDVTGSHGPQGPAVNKRKHLRRFFFDQRTIASLLGPPHGAGDRLAHFDVTNGPSAAGTEQDISEATTLT